MEEEGGKERKRGIFKAESGQMDGEDDKGGQLAKRGKGKRDDRVGREGIYKGRESLKRKRKRQGREA